MPREGFDVWPGASNVPSARPPHGPPTGEGQAAASTPGSEGTPGRRRSPEPASPSPPSRAGAAALYIGTATRLRAMQRGQCSGASRFGYTRIERPQLGQLLNGMGTPRFGLDGEARSVAP